MLFSVEHSLDANKTHLQTALAAVINGQPQVIVRSAELLKGEASNHALLQVRAQSQGSSVVKEFQNILMNGPYLKADPITQRMVPVFIHTIEAVDDPMFDGEEIPLEGLSPMFDHHDPNWPHPPQAANDQKTANPEEE